MLGIFSTPIHAGTGKANEDAAVKTALTISLAMKDYSLDHQGLYPDGGTSTEVFQKLIDGKYVTDPAIFFLTLPGKTRATSTTLAADNVCFDVTAGVTASSPPQLPVVFCSGFEVTYFPGDSAMRNFGRATPFPGEPPSYHPGPPSATGGVVVACKNGNPRFMRADGNGIIHFFMPMDFAPKGETYRQLHP